MNGLGQVLEVFYILFKSNADEVDKGAEKAKKSTNKLEDALKGADERTVAVGKAFLAVAGGAAAAIAGVASFTALMNSAIEASKYANTLSDLANSIDVNIEELSAWSDAVASSGGTAEGFHQTVRGLAEDFAQISTTGKSRLLPFFKELGISIKDSNGHVRDVMEVLPDLADAFGKMDKQKALGLGGKLGLDQGTIMLLQQGRREVELVIARQKELGFVTAEQARISKAYNDQIADTAHAWRTLSLDFATAILPVLTALSRQIEHIFTWVHSHKDLIVGFFLAISGAIMAYAVPAFLTFAAVTAPIWAPIAAGIAIVAALAAAFALLYEDVAVFARGGDSLTGKIWNWLKSFESLRKAAEFLYNALYKLGELEDKLFKGAGKAWNWLTDNNQDNVTATNFARGRQAIATANADPLAGLSHTAIANSTNNNTRSITVPIENLTVQTQATDADGIAAAMGASLNTQMRQALNNYDDGVQM